MITPFIFLVDDIVYFTLYQFNAKYTIALAFYSLSATKKKTPAVNKPIMMFLFKGYEYTNRLFVVDDEDSFSAPNDISLVYNNNVDDHGSKKTLY